MYFGYYVFIHRFQMEEFCLFVCLFYDNSVFHLCVGENHSYSKLFLRSLPHPGEKVWWLKPQAQKQRASL